MTAVTDTTPAQGETRDVTPGAAPESVARAEPAGPPRGRGAVGAAGPLLALALGAAGMTGVHDGLVATGAVSGGSWIERGLDLLDGLEPQWWTVPAGIVAVLAGIWLIAAAVRPRPRRALPVAGGTGVYLDRRAVGTLARRAARDVDGVTAVKTRLGRRASVRLRTTGSGQRIADDVREAVEAKLAGLERPPKIKVSARIVEPGGPR